MDGRIAAILDMGQRSLTAFLLRRKIIISFRLGPARPSSKERLWVGWGDAISKRRAEGLPPVAILLLLPTFKRMIFSLFTLKSFNNWPILIADLLLYNFLHLLILSSCLGMPGLAVHYTLPAMLLKQDISCFIFPINSSLCSNSAEL